MGIFHAQEILVEEIRIECGNEYFSETSSSQPALIARGKASWCQNGYIYSIVSVGDSVKVKAFRNGLSFTGTTIEYDPSGAMIGEYEFINGFMQKLQTFYVDGTVKTVLNFQNGTPDGKHIVFYPNGNIDREFVYKNGLLHGEIRTYDTDGTLVSLSNYKDNIMDGPFYHYYLNEVDLPTCYQRGFANNGVETITEDTCN
jgi:antitoxin component YwqK of YwqJK toxin-antitoxin module